MFEKEIKFIADFNLNKIKSLGSFITFEKLLSSNIHPAVVQYISAELDYLISEDRKKLLQQSVFDYSGAEVSKHFNLIAQEIKKAKKISYEDIKKLIIQAVSFNVNYIVRPKWSLTKLVFNEFDNKSIEEIKLDFNYLYYYDYIKNIFLSYLTKRKLQALSITEFELILNKIDRELFAAQPQKLVDNTLFSMAEFFNGGGAGNNKISPLIIELFLKEKNLMDYLLRLKKAFPSEGKQRIDVEEIKKIIYSKTPVERQESFFDEGLPESEREIISPSSNEEAEFKIQNEIVNDAETETEDKNQNALPGIKIGNKLLRDESEENLIEHNIEEDLPGFEIESDTGIDEDLLAIYEK